ncbi:DUF1643 domain-containing protein [Leifsonia poae]|uniref:DUF1643 domain-containing protein n=1 Tax=Leifsonia poae TaxID=110933 RepID=UPI0035A9AAE2
MTGVFQQRATQPSDMHVAYSPELKAENERHIAEFIGGRRLELLAAWGETIMARSYLRGMLRGIVGLPEAASCNWRSIGDPLKERPSAPPLASKLCVATASVRHSRLSAWAVKCFCVRTRSINC